jgi:hypothetical protein
MPLPVIHIVFGIEPKAVLAPKFFGQLAQTFLDRVACVSLIAVVVPINCSYEAIDRRTCGRDFTFHAATGVPDHAQADRRVIGIAEVGDRQNLPVLVDREIRSQLRNH